MEPVFGCRQRSFDLKAQPAKPGCSDGNEKRFLRFDAALEIGDPAPDQILAG
jgi:hypothetical protein